jgi:hypothetical protein
VRNSVVNSVVNRVRNSVSVKIVITDNFALHSGPHTDPALALTLPLRLNALILIRSRFRFCFGTVALENIPRDKDPIHVLVSRVAFHSARDKHKCPAFVGQLI